MPKRKPLLTSDGRPHSYGSVVSLRALALRAEQRVDAREEPADGAAETEEDDRGEIGPKHGHRL